MGPELTTQRKTPKLQPRGKSGISEVLTYM